MDDVRFWVGCAGPVAPIVCAAWNTGMLDTGATHASCCDFPEAARAVAALVKGTITALRSHGQAQKVPDLTPGTDEPPADIRTSASHSLTASDASVSCPQVTCCGVHCTHAPQCPPRPGLGSQHLSGGSQHLNFLEGIETHFGCVEIHFDGVERHFVLVLRSILGVIEPCCWCCTKGNY